MSLRLQLLLTTALTTVGWSWLVFPAPAADAIVDSFTPDPSTALGAPAPAVSSFNFKFDIFGGHADAESPAVDYDESLYGGSASFSVPLTERFGLQVDGMTGHYGGDQFYIVAGHLFWRDPSVGLLGAFGSHTMLDRGPWQEIGVDSGLYANRIGVEGELYLGAYTLEARVGQESGDIDDKFFAELDAEWYASPDLKFSAGWRHSGGGDALALGTEYLLPGEFAGGRSALFAEGRFGNDDNSAVWGGLRVYFGQSQTLIDKHRYDDPDGPEPDLFSLQALAGELDAAEEACIIISCDVF